VTALFATGWGTLAVIDAIIARLKGKSMILWFFLTLLFGPVATVVLLLSNKSQKAAVG
jgi:hypothetical protein